MSSSHSTQGKNKRQTSLPGSSPIPQSLTTHPEDREILKVLEELEEPGMVELQLLQEDLKFEASLGYMVNSKAMRLLEGDSKKLIK